MSKTKGNDQNPPPQGRNRRKGEVSDGQHAQIQAISKGQKPSAFFVRNNPNWEVHVFRVVKPFVPLAGTGWHPYTFESVKRGVDPRVARCWQLRKSPRYSRFAGPGDHLRPTRHFFGRFFGQPSRSILQRDKGGWSLCALPPGNTAPQRGSGLRRRWSVSGLFAVGGGQKSQKSKDMPTVGRFRRWPLWVVYQNSGGKNVPKYKHSC